MGQERILDWAQELRVRGEASAIDAIGIGLSIHSLFLFFIAVHRCSSLANLLFFKQGYEALWIERTIFGPADLQIPFSG